LTRLLCDSLNRTSEENCSIHKSLFLNSLSPTHRVIFFLFYLHVCSKHKTLNLYTQALLLPRRPPCWKNTARHTLDTFVSTRATRSTKSNVSSRAKWNLGLIGYFCQLMHTVTEEEDNQRTPGRDLEMWTAGYKYSWKKMETAAQNKAEDGEEWSVPYLPPWVK